MTALVWDQTGEREYETGVDRGVLFPQGDPGVAWNGLTTVTESPAGAESNKTYADNIVYGNLISVETFAGTIEAYTYPDEFAECDGSVEASPGVLIGQQARKGFGFCYRTLVGNDQDQEAGYKLHLVYGAKATPSEKAFATVNDSPEMIAFSWEVDTVPVPVTDLKPTSLIVVDSTTVDPDALAALELILYGNTGVDPRLPLPDEVISIFEDTLTEVHLVGANAPSFDEGTNVVTIPVVVGVTWYVNGVAASTGAQDALDVGESSYITATANAGYFITGDDDWVFDYVA
jgi:hypothetical protein